MASSAKERLKKLVKTGGGIWASVSFEGLHDLSFDLQQGQRYVFSPCFARNTNSILRSIPSSILSKAGANLDLCVERVISAA